MKVVVTGAVGFTGRHLVSLLREEGAAELTLVSRGGPPEGEPGDCVRCDLAEPGAARALLERARPERIYHLAGSFTQDYESDYRANVLAARRLLDAVWELSLPARVLLVGTAAEYGAVLPGENPIGEDRPLRPASVYGLTKAFQTELALFHHRAHGAHVLIARPFNLFGRGVSERLFPGRLERLIDEYRAGRVERIRLGNLEHRRDFMAVGDAVRLYRTIMERGEAGETYNVGTGRPTRVRDFLHRALAEAGLDPAIVDERPCEHPGKLDVPEVFADVRKVTALLRG